MSEAIRELAAGVRAADRAAIGRALTLVESRHPEHERRAQELLAELLPHTGEAHRVGISGTPGAGKSTLLEALGLLLLERGHRVAVMAVDPSSTVSGGSILGDKTRMPRLAREPDAFIRPSPSAGALGGVARRSREAQLILEAAGFDVLLLETVGVGQSEGAVADLVDTFLVLLAPGAGDELQGIKRGILELAHLVVITKADGDLRAAAERARRDYAAALALLDPGEEGWRPHVVAASALTGDGVAELWEAVEAHREHLRQDSRGEQRRRRQRVRWMWEIVEERLLGALRSDPQAAAEARRLEEALMAGATTPRLAAEQILAAWRLQPSTAPTRTEEGT